MLRKLIFGPVNILIFLVTMPFKIFLWMLYFLLFKRNDY